MSIPLAPSVLAALLTSSAASAAPPHSITTPLALVADDTNPSDTFATADVRQLSANQSFKDYDTLYLNSVSDVSISAVPDPLFNPQGNTLLKVAALSVVGLLVHRRKAS